MFGRILTSSGRKLTARRFQLWPCPRRKTTPRTDPRLRIREEWYICSGAGRSLRLTATLARVKTPTVGESRMPAVYSTADRWREKPTGGRIPGIRGRVAIRRRERAAPENHSDLAFLSPNPLRFSVYDPIRGLKSGPRWRTIPSRRASCQAKSTTYRSAIRHDPRM